jgi:rRNA-processing protein FCF1
MNSYVILLMRKLTPGIPTISDCVLAELEKLGPKYRLALKIAKDPRFERVHCDRELM